MSEVLVVGSVALDTVETPFGRRDELLGGSATMFALSAARFAPVRLVGIVGKDFPESHVALLKSQGIDIAGLQKSDGKTFRWHGRYNATMDKRETVSVQLNVLGDFHPVLPPAYRNTAYAFLGNGSPETQEAVLRQMSSPKFVMMDTMNLWLENNRAEVERLMTKVHGLCINEEESLMLSRASDVKGAAKTIAAMGCKTLIVKQAEKGATLFIDGAPFHVEGYRTARAIDPTGAGDSFAGGFMGCIARSDDISPATLRKAIVYGNAMGSINVEGFGPDALVRATWEEIEKRFSELNASSGKR